MAECLGGHNDIVPPMTHKSPNLARILPLILALPILTAAPPQAHPSTDPTAVEVLQVRAYRQQKLQAVVSGFAVNEQGAVLTSAHALRRAGRLTVTLGAGSSEVVAELVWRDEDSDTALLNATGIGAAPLVFAAGGLAAGRRVSTAWRAADGRLLTARGALGVADADAPYQHNAMVTADGYGAPLLDECGRAVGMNRRAPGGWSILATRAAAPEGAVFATAAPQLLALLAAKSVAYQALAEPCESAEEAAVSSAAEARAKASAAEGAAEDARAQAATAEEAAEAARAHASAAEQAAAQARSEAEDAQQRADLSDAEKAELQAELQRAEEAKEQAAADARRAAEQAAQQAEAAQAAAEEAAAARQVAQQTAQKNRRNLIIGVGVAGLLALLALLVFIRRGRAARRRVAAAESKAEEAARQAQGPDPGSRPGWSFTVIADDAGGETAGDFGDEIDAKVAAVSGDKLAADSPAEAAADFYLSAALLQAAAQGVRIGRNPESCDVVVASPAVSREHCRIFFADGQLMLEDLKSANGTRIGARRLEAHAPAAIQAGDRIALGDIEFKVVYVA